MKDLEPIKRILHKYKKDLVKKYKIKEIGIFGSYVRRKKKRNDLDIIVDFEETPDLLTFIEIERYLKEILGVNVDLVRKSALRPELREMILNEAIRIM